MIMYAMIIFAIDTITTNAYENRIESLKKPK